MVVLCGLIEEFEREKFALSLSSNPLANVSVRARVHVFGRERERELASVNLLACHGIHAVSSFSRAPIERCTFQVLLRRGFTKEEVVQKMPALMAAMIAYAEEHK